MRLTRRWIRFQETEKQANPFPLGCGVTAYSLADALALIARALNQASVPPVASVVENVDVSELDSARILPNIGCPAVRGVWYPNLGDR